MRDKKKERREQNEKGKKSKKNMALITSATLILFAAVLIGSFEIVRAMGRNRLMNEANTVKPALETTQQEELTEEEKRVWEEGWVKYQDVIYQYNEEIMTFLIMGIDKKNDVKEVAEGTDGGQADAIFLAVMNPKNKSIKVIAVNRNTMTDIDVYDEEGNYFTTVKAQLATQHGFGNGVEKSCEYQQRAVQKLFYQMPVHGYAAINMSAIETINDAVGGIDVTLTADMTNINKEFTKGNTVHLEGKNAFWYVKYRDVNVFGSADERLGRQKQYLRAFIGKTKEKVAADLTVVADLYQAVMSQMVTNVSLDEATYLASILKDYRFSEEDLYTMAGETVMGEQFEEFYPDETALYEMILEIFYEEVEQNAQKMTEE